MQTRLGDKNDPPVIVPIVLNNLNPSIMEGKKMLITLVLASNNQLHVPFSGYLLN